MNEFVDEAIIGADESDVFMSRSATNQNEDGFSNESDAVQMTNTNRRYGPADKENMSPLVFLLEKP